MQVLRGIAISPGLAIGAARTHDPRRPGLPAPDIDAEHVPAELERLDRALDAARRTAEADEADARRRLGPQYADILAAHARMIADRTLLRDARERIESGPTSAEHAVTDVLDAHATRLENLDDAFLAARAVDVRDIQRRILDQLAADRTGVAGTAAPTVSETVEPHLILAHDITPSEAARLDPNATIGFATEAGGQASHTAIVAAALEIPAVAALGPFLEKARGARTAIVDGDEGLLVLNPDGPTLERYQKAAAERRERFAGLDRFLHLPTRTRDGVGLELHGNIEFPAEAAACRDRGADGIGLYRTEFLYLGADRPPTEEEQFEAYATVVRAMDGRPVTIRTLDLGADRLVSYENTSTQARNPSLGLRSIRLSLRRPALFRTQLRAILRASPLGDVRVMFPLITTLDEFRRARAMLDEVAGELRSEGVAVRDDLPVGAMIEVPAAAVIADRLAREVDFFSIGTNDLVQYALAVDRTDESVADLYSAADPAVLRLIAMIARAAAEAPRPIPVNVCGSIGGEPAFTALLIGMGLRQLSMPPHQLLEVKRVIRAIDLADAVRLADAALACETTAEIERLLQASLASTPNDAPAVG
jgi:phosphotransferase system enzyme I (PtsI)